MLGLFTCLHSNIIVGRAALRWTHLPPMGFINSINAGFLEYLDLSCDWSSVLNGMKM